MKLIWSVLYLGKSGIEVCASDKTGERRKVNITWHAKDKGDEPPSNWATMVEREMAFQDSEKLTPDVQSMSRAALRKNKQP
jgi:hypothetical protein